MRIKASLHIFDAITHILGRLGKMSEIHQMRERLLDRLIAGEIDQDSYDRMLLEIRRYQDDLANETPGEGTSTSFVPRGSFLRGPLCVRDGTRLGKFTIDSLLGRGGMGEVWKAYDPIAERDVVLKILPRQLQTSERHLEHLKECFQQVHMLQHPHICPVYDLGYDEQCGYYLVMKYISGPTIADYVKDDAGDKRPIVPARATNILAPVAQALDYAHARRVMHRDIKPENIMLELPDEIVQVVDFGLAAQIRTSLSQLSRIQMEVAGTPPYMSPEQWKGHYQDGRTDQYALAVVAYQLITGAVPFDADAFHVVYHKVLNDPLPPLDAPLKMVQEVLKRGMAKSREDRYSTCCEFLAALSAAVQCTTR